MKRLAFLLPILLLGLTGCAAQQPCLPELTAEAGEERGCAAVFPQGRWEFVHTIEFSMADGSGATVLGVTSLAGDEISCALMTVEGFTLFEAVDRERGGLEVRRAVPPFDKPAFAAGLMEDVRTIFRAPTSINVQYGHSADKVPICRYTGVEGRITDILPAMAGCWQIRTYGAEQILNRSVVGSSCRKEGESLIPEHLELKGFGHTNYTLKMTLIHVEHLNGNALP
ncbi:MAG: hypothetical protein ACYDHV_12555 [Desulfurivibrionaceae bacterium]|jgi:hypothetical protein|nr:hypothetical protein [Pseudomonadota bacterium]PKN21713.1 MAG: hypothetical protein CVU68_06610 [Deltaproteobacteria bacterium HGW-Deltaproteobacteria-3]